jgi:WD40 repeat protein/tRNA A-37 threonylcarbamoyl transferase component Bud32
MSMQGDERDLDTLTSGRSSGGPATLATMDGAAVTGDIEVDGGTMATLGAGAPHGSSATSGVGATLGATSGSSNATHATLGLDPGSARAAKPSALAEGSRIGRFLILRKLGEGGMGVVFVGYDGELDRRVALKLLRARHDDGRAITRLVREAQGLARLSHPNVVQIYEVGQHDGSMFIAMELILGHTLGDWLAAEPRRWVEILDVLLQAGHGLAAAHAAKLIHRDFKPDNMMVADDGRVRVLDFGLVRGESEREGEALVAAATEAPLDHALTMAGSLLGTPAYMAPEQIAGRIADALSDQFSFCVAAFEALYGERPFAGRTLGEIAQAIASGRIRTPPRERKVPRRVHRAIVRGLAADPKQRWPSMDRLLAELEASLAVRRGYMWAGAALASAIALASVIGLASAVRERDADLLQLNSRLEAKLAQLERTQSTQRGLQAEALVELDEEAEALKLAVLAVGPYAATDDAPIEATHALETVLADDAQIIAPVATLTSDSPMLWDAAFSPDAARVVTAGHDHFARIHDAQTGELVMTLIGHAGVVRSALFLPDGVRVATASYDHSVRLWDSRTGEQLGKLDHADAVVTMRISADGSRLASASYDGATKLWDTASQQAIDTLRTDSPRPPALAFDPAGARLATTSRDNGVTIWSTSDAAALTLLSGHTEPISALAYAPDGARLATVSYDGSARLWDAQTGRELAVIDRRAQRLHSLAFSRDGTKLVIGGEDRLARVHDLVHGRVLATLVGHQGWVTAVAFTPNGHKVLTASPDATVRVWEALTGKLRATARGHEGNIHSLRQASEGKRSLSSGEDGKARVWDFDIDTSVVKTEGHRGRITSIEFAPRLAPEAAQIATASEDSTIKLWTPSSGALVATLGEHTAAVAAATYSPDGQRLASASWDDHVRIWDPASGELVHTLVGHDNDVLVLAWSPDGSQLASAGLDRRVRIWDPVTGELLDTRVGFEDWINALAYAPSGSQLAVGSADGLVRVFATGGSQRIATLEQHEQSNCPVWLSYAPDGQLATGSCDNQAMLWNVAHGSLAPLWFGRFEGHGNSVVALAFAPDGARLATASADETAKVWGVFGGQLLATLSGHRGALTAIAFTPDGARLATGSKDRDVKLWDVVTGELRMTLPPQRGEITALTFAPDGELLAVASEDRASIWDARSGELRSMLEDHVGLRGDAEVEPDVVGRAHAPRLSWPIPTLRLLELGCERLRGFAAYAEAAAICDPLRAE